MERSAFVPDPLAAEEPVTFRDVAVTQQTHEGETMSIDQDHAKDNATERHPGTAQAQRESTLEQPQTLAAYQQLVYKLQAQNAALEQTCDDLRLRLEQGRAPEGAAQSAEVHQLQERVKELTCLYAISDLLQHQELDLESLAQRFVELIVAAYQYPEVACARLQLSGWSRATRNYAETPWQQASDVVVEGIAIGLLVVGYLEERPCAAAGPFLPE